MKRQVTGEGIDMKSEILAAAFTTILMSSACATQPTPPPSDGASPADITAAPEDLSPYVDSVGDELFGEGFQPEFVTDVGPALEVGRANSGSELGKLYQLASHDEAATFTDALSERPEAPESVFSEVELPALNTRRGDDPSDISETIAWPTNGLLSATNIASDFGSAVMFVHFVDVGQGDATILEFPCGVAVIDTGGGRKHPTDMSGGQKFVDYLDAFFAQRPHLNDTIDVLFTTHPHVDHLNGARLLINRDGSLRYNVLNLVDNGQTGRRGGLKHQRTIRNAMKSAGAGYSALSVDRLFNALGGTNEIIDPIDCVESNVDPVITAFWGGWNLQMMEALGGEGLGANEPNDHSLVLRIDFGTASFLFTGDLEHHGADDLLKVYQNNLEVFDVDVYQVSHHGAEGDTSDALIEVMSPQIAVISMGHPNDPGGSSATKYGHPRTEVIDLMQDEPHIISGERTESKQYWSYAEAKAEPQPIEIDRAIYGTGWEGNIVLKATTSGDYEISYSSGSPST